VALAGNYSDTAIIYLWPCKYGEKGVRNAMVTIFVVGAAWIGIDALVVLFLWRCGRTN